MVIFCTQGRVDVEPPSVADSLRACATASPRAWQATVDTVVDDVEDEVVEIFFVELSAQLLTCCLFLINMYVRRLEAFLDVFTQKYSSAADLFFLFCVTWRS
jgi:hypothetical protein